MAAKKKPATKPGAKRDAAIAWFANLSARIAAPTVLELQALIAEAREYDLVGLQEALGDEQQVLDLNHAANALIQAGLDTYGPDSPHGFQLQILRDILNDS